MKASVVKAAMLQEDGSFAFISIVVVVNLVRVSAYDGNDSE